MAPRRQYPFEGTQKEYVKHLEERVRFWQSRATSAERQLDVLRSQAATQHSQIVPPTPDGIPGLTFNVETLETFKYDNKTPIEEPKWEAATSDFLAGVPTTKAQWLERRVEVQLSTPEQIINAFHLLTCRRHHTHSSYPVDESAAGPLKAVGAYGNLLSFLRKTSRCSTQLYNYSQLLFFCVCCVARKNGLGVEEVDGFAKKHLPEREASSSYMSRLRRAAQWAAQLIDDLEDTLGHLASSLFLFCGPAMSTYRDYTTWTETAEYLAGQIKAKTKPLQLEPPDEARISFSPAFLIAYVGPWTLDQVNTALGTNLTQEKYDDRIRNLRETGAFARESRAGSTAISNDGPSSPPTTESPSPQDHSPTTSTTSSRPAKRRRTGQEADEHCHDNSGWDSAPRGGSSPLNVPPDAARQECARQRASRPVPTLGGVEQASSHDGSPVSHGSLLGIPGARHEPLGHGHDTEAASPRGSPPNEPDVESATPALVPVGHSFRGVSPCATESASTRDREESGTTAFRPINTNLQLTGQDRVGGFCRGNSDRVLAQQASPLDLLANVAGWEHEERPIGAVPTLDPVEPISGTLVLPPDESDVESFPSLFGDQGYPLDQGGRRSYLPGLCPRAEGGTEADGTGIDTRRQGVPAGTVGSPATEISRLTPDEHGQVSTGRDLQEVSSTEHIDIDEVSGCFLLDTSFFDLSAAGLSLPL